MTFSDIIGQGGFLAVFGMGIVVGYLFSMVFGPVAKERASAAGREVKRPKQSKPFDGQGKEKRRKLHRVKQAMQACAI